MRGSARSPGSPGGLSRANRANADRDRRQDDMRCEYRRVPARTSTRPRRRVCQHHGPERGDRHHPPRHHPAPAAVRHRLAARTALPPVHHQESPDPQKPPRRPGRDPAAPAPAARHHAGRAAERAASSLTRDPAIPARHRRTGIPARPRCRKRPQEHGLPRTGAAAGPLARTRLTKSNRNSSRTAPTRPVAGYKT